MALGGEIGSAFVRLRPNLSGFAGEATAGVKQALRATQEEVNVAARAQVEAAVRSVRANRDLAASYKQIGSAAAKGSDEARVAGRLAAQSTEAANAAIGRSAAAARSEVGGLRSRLIDLAKIAGLAFGAERTFAFAKEITGQAAQVQKSIEVIRSTFGREASEVVVKFGDRTAAALGLSAAAANATSARFGILFKNIGIGPQLAANMTVNLEKLAGTLSIIRGVDPSRALQQITLAMLGNVRSLKQLGLAVDIPTEKIAAFKLGLISNVKEALTPATRAQAIYALATSHLAQFQQEASKHAGDLASQQFKLRAEWANATDALGTALLPEMARLTGRLADYLGGLLKTGELQRKVSVYLHDFGQVIHGVGAVLSPAVKLLQGLVHVLGGAGNAIKVFLAAFVIGKIAAFSKAIVDMLLKRGILLIGPAATAAEGEASAAFFGIGVSAEAMSATLKAALVSTGIGALAVAAGIAAVEIIQHWSTVKRWFADFVGWIRPELNIVKDGFQAFVAFVGRIWRDWGSTIVQVAREQWALVKGLVQNALDAIRGIFDVFKGLFTGDWGLLWKGLKTVAKAGLDNVKDVLVTFGKEALTIFEGIWKNIELLVLEGLSKVTGLLSKVPTSFKLFGHRIGISNPFKGITEDLKSQINAIDTARSAKEFADAAAANLAAAVRAKTNDPIIAGAGQDLGKSVAKSVKDGVKYGLDSSRGGSGAGSGNTGDAVANSIFNQSVKDAIAAAKKRLADAISSGNQSIAAAQQSLGNYILAGQKRIQAQITAGNQAVTKAAVAAGTNLDAIGKKLIATVGKYLDTGAAAADLAKGPLGQQFQRLKAAILSGRGGPELINAAQELATQLQAGQAKSGSITKQKTDMAKHISGLTDELNRGLISVKSFQKRVQDYLASQGVNYAKVGKALGKAQGDAYLAQLDAMFKQAGIIGAEPKHLRDVLRKSVEASTAGVKVIDPNAVRAAQERKIAQTKEDYDRGLRQREAAVGKATRAAAHREADARHAVLVTLQKEHLRVAQHQISEQKKATAAAKKAAKAAAATASTNAQIAATTVNTSGFPSATTKNPGVAAAKARAGAQGGLSG